MPKPFVRHYLCLFLMLCLHPALSQTITGKITDTTGKPLAFATVKLGATKQGVIADLNGNFSLHGKEGEDLLTVSYTGFETKKVSYKNQPLPLRIELLPSKTTLNEVVIVSNDRKLRRILNTAISNRDNNNPDKYDWYRCHVYYRMTADIKLPDSILDKDTGADGRIMRQLVKEQHMFMTETYSKRTWQQPQKLQEEIVASRVSGFKKALFTTLITDVLPFHTYNDYISMNGKDYHNPLAKGLFQRFKFRITDEILQGSDTLWLIAFEPRKKQDHLSGTLFIHSNSFAIAHLIANHHDSILKRDVGLEHQYQQIDGKWFPHQLNYIVNYKGLGVAGQEVVVQGTSLIDSVSYERDNRFRFDRAHTVKLLPGADERHDSAWQTIRSIPLDAKAEKTYNFLDSLGTKYKFDKYAGMVEKLVEGKIGIGIVDVDLKRLFSYNAYEKWRLGLGLQTNERVSKHFTVGGWFGYGTKDKSWKYGGFTEIFLNRYKEFKIRLSYNNDIRDPGRLQVHKDLDKNFLRMFLMSRVDKVETYGATISKKFGYLSTDIGFHYERIKPLYSYQLEHKNALVNHFETRELSINLRYAYGEKTAPSFGRYISMGTNYPVIYAKAIMGRIDYTDESYLQVIGAVSWQKHINRWGHERFLLVAGSTYSKDVLPLSKQFAGNGFQTGRSALHVFGGMQTMLPYEYYMDRFVNFYFKHDFDFRLYNLVISKRGLTSTPSLGVGYNFLWGDMDGAHRHKMVSFSIPNSSYHETGVMVNRLLKLKYLGLYHFNLNVGYFYHLTDKFNLGENGRVVIGVGVDL